MSVLSHDHLRTVWKALPSDYEPYGYANRDQAAEEGRLDCSSGCRWYHPLAGARGADWGVCCSPTSPRVGLLTFEHAGGATCFEPEEGVE